MMLFFGTEKYEEILNELGGELKYELLGERLLTTPNHAVFLKFLRDVIIHAHFAQFL
ncbi:MAG: hypothetical protein MZV64_03070 [Ignavibacteriales bacterium]|nr:hypothetical protein [Ignavibacteriales bacterium]